MAAGVVVWLQGIAQDIELALDAGGLALTVVSILGAAITILVGGPLALPLLAAIAALFIEINDVGFTAAFTEDTWLAVLCSVYSACADGVIDQAQANTNLESAKTTYNLDAAERLGVDVVKAVFGALGDDGLNNVGAMGQIAGADCSNCGETPGDCCSLGPHLGDGLSICGGVGGAREITGACVPITESGRYQVNLTFTVSPGPTPDEDCNPDWTAGFVVWQVQDPRNGRWYTYVGSESGHSTGTHYYSEEVPVNWACNTRLKLRITGAHSTWVNCLSCCIEKVD
jgi:hypothetical protein